MACSILERALQRNSSQHAELRSPGFTPLSAIFTLPGASTDWGWNFGRFEQLDLFVGSPGWVPKQGGGRYTTDLSRSMVVGFRTLDGEVVWRSRGTYVCGYLPCPDLSNPNYQTSAVVRGPSVGVRMLATGTASGRTAELPRTSADAKATLQGFDPATGKTRWSFFAGHNPGLITNLVPPPRLAAATLAIRGPSGTFESLSLGTGVHHALARATTAWCSHVMFYHLAAGYQIGGRSVHQYIGQYGYFPCSPNGRRLSTPKLVPRFVGSTFDGRVAWSDRRGVFVARTA
jgi:hypothetical protein